ncbi:hypothetical protein DFH11DRAFT_1592971 [Phellopilus nigrolimitatus]|nr:hypothetical protein DFH11DRAFT_1592971 [Phellopilus nigrolimitatus]
MYRGERLFAPTKGWRCWHVKVNQIQRRFSVDSVFSASALPGLVLAHGRCAERLERSPVAAVERISTLAWWQLWQRRLVRRKQRRLRWPRRLLRARARTASTSQCVRYCSSRARTTFPFLLLSPHSFCIIIYFFL